MANLTGICKKYFQRKALRNASEVDQLSYIGEIRVRHYATFAPPRKQIGAVMRNATGLAKNTGGPQKHNVPSKSVGSKAAAFCRKRYGIMRSGWRKPMASRSGCLKTRWGTSAEGVGPSRSVEAMVSVE